MGDEDKSQENVNVKMGASNNPNAARLSSLKERKQAIEEKLAVRNQELRKLCIQEAELTGIMPTEIPLEPGESPPSFRRRVGTAFQLPQNLINNLNNKEESITAIELEMQVQANLAEAALGLANEPNVGKPIRRQYMAQYQKHKQQYNILEEKLAFLKVHVRIPQQSSVSFNQQLKHKKKPRPPLDQDDNVSITGGGLVQIMDPFGNAVFRHSSRYSHNPYIVDAVSMDMRYNNAMIYRGAPDSISYSGEQLREEDVLSTNLLRMNINSYMGTKDRRGSSSSNSSAYVSPVYTHSHSNPNIYQQPYPAAVLSNTLPHPTSYRTTLVQSHSQQLALAASHPNLMVPHAVQHAPHSPHAQQMYHPSVETAVRSEVKNHQYYPSHTLPTVCYKHNVDVTGSAANPHQIQPHQQYEQDVMSSGGLGGFWRRSEGGDMIWCSSFANVEGSSSAQRDKRFGSLDRRKGRKINKRISPHTEVKSPMSAPPPIQSFLENARPECVVKNRQPNANRNRQENRQLVRTQSLGSVGAQTVDNSWPSDDNISCNSETPSISELNAASRKLKPKEWYETSLDGLPSKSQNQPAGGVTARSSVNSGNLSEDIYVAPNSKSPVPIKAPLEIPAESNPTVMSPMRENNMELYNNNVMDLPMNCTVVQAGQCKPYHEETKPFEMADFYKYSTKFRDRNTDKSGRSNSDVNSLLQHNAIGTSGQGNDNLESAEEKAIQKATYQPLQPLKCQALSPQTNFNSSYGPTAGPFSGNTSLDISQLTANVAENFTAEMDAWYTSKEHEPDNNNSMESSSNSRSAATLV